MLNKKCEFFPCHSKMDSCAFCYCPIFPCHIQGTGGKVTKNIWDCSSCEIIHDRDLVWMLKNKITHEIKRIVNEKNKQQQ